MRTTSTNHLHPLWTLAALGLLAWLLPNEYVDPWQLVNPHRISVFVLALAVFQALSAWTQQRWKNQMGFVLSGFLGGMISSTATTAALARASVDSNHQDPGLLALSFLSATMAMLLQAAALVAIGTKQLDASVFVLLAGPALAAAVCLFKLHRSEPASVVRIASLEFQLLPVLKLSAAILSLIALTKLLQSSLGPNSLFVVSFLSALFEAHGAIIANLQLHDAGHLSESLLVLLVGISLLASMISKLFLVRTLGSKQLTSLVARYSALLAAALVASTTLALLVVA